MSGKDYTGTVQNINKKYSSVSLKNQLCEMKGKIRRRVKKINGCSTL